MFLWIKFITQLWSPMLHQGLGKERRESSSVLLWVHSGWIKIVSVDKASRSPGEFCYFLICLGSTNFVTLSMILFAQMFTTVMPFESTDIFLVLFLRSKIFSIRSFFFFFPLKTCTSLFLYLLPPTLPPYFFPSFSLTTPWKRFLIGTNPSLFCMIKGFCVFLGIPLPLCCISHFLNGVENEGIIKGIPNKRVII